MTSNQFSSWHTLEEADAVKDILLSNKVNYWTGKFVVSLKKNLLLGLRPNMQLQGL